MEQASMEKIKSIYDNRDENRRKIGERIKHIRTNILHMTQPKFYELICPNNVVAQSTKGTTISSWEHATLKNDNKTAVTFPNLEQLCAIATAGGVSLEWLLMGNENKTPQDKPTWRGFCRSFMAIRKYMGVKIKVDPLSIGLSRHCNISILLQNPKTDGSWEKTSFAKNNIGSFLETLQTLNDNYNPTIAKFEDIILNDALNKVPNTPIPEKDDSMPF